MTSKRRWAFKGLSLFAVVLLISLFVAQRGPNFPADFSGGEPGPEINIEVVAGATGSEIAEILFEKGVVKSSAAFFAAAVEDKRSSRIAPGTHVVHTKIPAKQALEELLDSARISNLIQIREGAWTSEIVSLMEKSGFSSSDIKKSLTKIKVPKGFSGAEGVLFPAQYSFGKGTSALTALQLMVDRFSRAANASGIVQGDSNFTAMQLLTIASLVQAEGNTQDFAKISQVIRNRLRIGMPLQFDSTIHFIQGTRGEVYLSSASTNIDSAYNTYQHYGLPPGPIGNPGQKAMEAALHPVAGDWLYFITVTPGDTRFTSSHNQFLELKTLYQNNLRAGKFGDQK